MLKLFKRFFSSQREIVERSCLKDFLQKQQSQEEEKVSSLFQSQKEELQELEESCKDLCTSLQERSLRNDKISQREKDLMQGNRQAYARGVLRVLDRIPSLDQKTFLEEFDAFSEEAKRFVQNSLRQKHILNQFFANDVRDIDIKLKAIRDSLLRLKNALQAKILQEARVLLSLEEELVSLQEQEEELRLMTLEREEKEKVLVIELEDLNAQLDEARNAKDLLFAKRKVQEQQEILDSLREDINNLFSPLKSALRKYAKISVDKERLFLSYADDPVIAFSHDISLEIQAGILEMAAAVHKESLSLKEGKKEKVALALQQLQDEDLLAFQKRYAQSSKDCEDAMKQFDKDPSLKRLRSLQAKKESVEKDLKHVRDDLLSFEKRLSNLDIQGKEERLCKGVEELFSVNIKSD